MKKYFVSTLALCFFACSLFAKRTDGPRPDSVTVYVFLGEECIVSQYFTQQLNQLHEAFSDENLAFIGLFPNPSSTPEKITAFRKRYALTFPLKLDVLQRKMDAFEVKVTPEVVVFNESKNEVIYQGRIDNTFFRVGKRRTVTTTSDLREALQNFTEGKEIYIDKTQPIGCFITPLKGHLKNVPMCSDTADEGR